MGEYEIMLLTRSSLDEEARGAILERAKSAVTSTGGTWGDVAEWGRRTMTYPIQKQPDAHYHVVAFDGTGATSDEVVRVLRITDGVLRVMSTGRVPAYPEGISLDVVTDEELAAGPPQRGRGRGGRGGGRGRDRDRDDR